MQEKNNLQERVYMPARGAVSDQEIPTPAFILSLVAGVLFLVGTLVSTVFMDGGMMGSMGSMMEDYGGTRFTGTWDILSSVVGFAVSAMVIYAAIMLNSKPDQHVTWGTLILVFSVLSVFGSMGGFFIGLILGVVGGAWAIAWRPAGIGMFGGQARRFCPNCGRAIAMDAQFCSYCGQQLPA